MRKDVACRVLVGLVAIAAACTFLISLAAIVPFRTLNSAREKLVKKNEETVEAAATTREREREYEFANETALVMRTVAPVRPMILDKIYKLASELDRQHSKYDFWLVVDETSNSQAKQRLSTYFAMNGGSIQPPQVFSVSEKALFERFPNLTSYFFNEPEPNYFNGTGKCCGFPVMWQSFIPVFGMFMESNTKYRYAWSFEDDIGLLGQQSLYDLIRGWDLKLNSDADLAAVELKTNHWGEPRHTMKMHRIVEAMRRAKVKWRLYSDIIQRHSRPLSRSIVTEASNNVMQFGERLVYPIAWKHNHTCVNLETFSEKYTFGFNKLTGEGKLTSSAGIENLLKAKSTPATYIFHEQIPAKRMLLRTR